MTSIDETGINSSSAISLRLRMALCDIASEKVLLRHIQHITNCRFPEEDGLYKELAALISSQPDAIMSAKACFQVWKAIKLEDQLAILDCFLQLSYRQTRNFSLDQKVKLFCRLFICDMIPVLGRNQSFSHSDFASGNNGDS